MPKQGYVLDNNVDTALPKGPRYNMVGYVSLGSRCPPRSLTSQHVDLGYILLASSIEASPPGLSASCEPRQLSIAPPENSYSVVFRADRPN